MGNRINSFCKLILITLYICVPDLLRNCFRLEYLPNLMSKLRRFSKYIGLSRHGCVTSQVNGRRGKEWEVLPLTCPSRCYLRWSTFLQVTAAVHLGEVRSSVPKMSFRFQNFIFHLYAALSLLVDSRCEMRPRLSLF